MWHRLINRGSLLEIADRARMLAKTGATPTARWSFAQICQHIALSIEATLINAKVTVGAHNTAFRPNSDTPSPLPPDQGRGLMNSLRRWFFRRVILTFGYIPPGVAVPDGVYPDQHAVLETELGHLESAARAFEAAALEPDRAWPAQRFTGALTAAEWRLFHHVHAAHHLARLARRSSGA